MALNNLFLLVSMAIVCLAPGIHGTAHLSFDSSSAQVNITRAGCGVTRVCVDQEMNCNSSMEGSCLFASLEVISMTAPNGSVLDITMQGTATPNQYIAIGLRPNAGTTLVFVCGRATGTRVLFFTRDLNSSVLVPSETRVRQILGNITGDLLQCQFTVPSVNATQARSADTTFAVLLGRGALGNPISGPVGVFNVSRTTDPLNFADPPSTVSTTAAPTTSAPTTSPTSSGPPSFISSAHVLLWSVLALPALLRM